MFVMYATKAGTEMFLMKKRDPGPVPKSLFT